LKTLDNQVQQYVKERQATALVAEKKQQATSEHTKKHACAADMSMFFG